MNTDSEPQNGIRVETRGPLGTLVLSRSATLNALTIDMVKALNEGLRNLESDNAIKLILIRSDSDRAFCAGGDMKQIRQHAMNGEHDAIRRYFTNEYTLNLSIARCRKPYMALIDGVAMGGGLGVSVHGRYRIVTEKALLAMPESRIGFFPDVGASYFLPQLPQRCGYWLGLTSASVKGRQAVQVGLATHYLPGESIDTLLDTLEAALQSDAVSQGDGACQVVDDILATATKQQLEGEERAAVDDCEAFERVLAKRAHWFGDDDIEAIRTRLQQDADDSEDAAHLLALLNSASPYSLATTVQLFRQTSGLALEDCLQLELLAAQEGCRHPDLIEGVRAVLVDKDRNPQWAA